jgi:hypothetical protein
MSETKKKQFGVWMDSYHATIAGRESISDREFVILGHVKNSGPDNNSNEHASHNQEMTLTHKFFKEITSKMPNVDEVHITGIGQIQEQFIKYLGLTPQFRNTASSESTSMKMSDDQFLTFIGKHFN